MADNFIGWPRSLRPPWRISHLLVLCVVAVALPLFGLVAYDAWRLAAAERNRLSTDAIQTAEQITANLDQTLNSYLVILQTLATSPALAEDDLAAVYRQASAALEPHGLFAFLRDLKGQQLLNTRVAYGTALPTTQGFDGALPESKDPFISDIVIGEVAKHPVIGMSVPVIRSGRTRYMLSLSLEPILFKELLDRQKLAPEWSSTIVDRAGVIIARTREHDKFVGKPIAESGLLEIGSGGQRGKDIQGQDVIWGRDTSRHSGWTVIATVPASIADNAVRSTLLNFIMALSTITGLSLGGAWLLGRAIVRPLDDAAQAARDLGSGKRVNFTPSILIEANAIGTALIESDKQRRRSEQQIRLLMREVSHRSKNMLAVVQAVARQMAGAKEPSFVERFSQRLTGLAAGQDLLIESNWQGVPVGNLVRSQLAPFRDLFGTRITDTGPLVRLTPAATQAVGMALHELATNAGKYGALSGASGRVDVTWDVPMTGEGRQFKMRWEESDGPPVEGVQRKGFGYTVMVSLVEKAVDGKVEVTYPVTGVVWSLSSPAESALENGNDNDDAPAAKTA